MISAITQTPHATYEEADSNPTWTGEGAYIPVFIGLTGNTVTTPEIKKIKNYAAAKKSTELGGIGTDVENNPLLKALKEFFEEAAKKNSDDISIPYVYVIDMGSIALSNLETWANAFELAKTKREARVEAIVGFKTSDSALDVCGVMTSAHTSILNDAKKGAARTVLTTIGGATDEQLIAYTDEDTTVTITVGEGAEATTKEVPAYIQESRVGLTEPKKFGKIVARICTTAYDVEPGYEDFRTLAGGEFSNRTSAEEEALMNAGIIFIRDELADNVIHPKICLAVSTAFAKEPELRPKDCLFHARRNVDHLINRVYDKLYTQLKRNESKVKIGKLQTDVDEIVDDEISKEAMMPGTKCIVEEDSANPYKVKVSGNAVPVNSTLYINFSMYVSEPNIVVSD